MTKSFNLPPSSAISGDSLDTGYSYVKKVPISVEKCFSATRIKRKNWGKLPRIEKLCLINHESSNLLPAKWILVTILESHLHHFVAAKKVPMSVWKFVSENELNWKSEQSCIKKVKVSVCDFLSPLSYIGIKLPRFSDSSLGCRRSVIKVHFYLAIMFFRLL